MKANRWLAPLTLLLLGVASCATPPMIVVVVVEPPSTPPSSSAGGGGPSNPQRSTLLLPICVMSECDREGGCRAAVTSEVLRSARQTIPSAAFSSSSVFMVGDRSYGVRASVPQAQVGEFKARWADVGCTTSTPNQPAEPTLLRNCRASMPDWIDILTSPPRESAELRLLGQQPFRVSCADAL